MTQKNARKQWKRLIAAGLAMGLTAATAQAQAGGADKADYRQLTREQQQMLADQVRDFAREQTIRLMLSNAGFADKTVQDEVIAFAKEQNAATEKLSEQNLKMMGSLRDQATPVAQLSALMNDYRAAQEDETMRRKTAVDALDAKINFRKQPRLEAVLTTLSLVGDEMAVAGLGDATNGGFGGGGFGGGGGRFGAFGGGGQGGGFGGNGGGRGGFGAFGGGDQGGGDRGGRDRGGDQGGRDRGGDQGGRNRGGDRGGNRGDRNRGGNPGAPAAGA